MGVPKFFRYICERYPCILEKLHEHQIPDFDNLYLDMNGIFHICSHPSDDVDFRVTEEEIFKNIFHYTNYIFQLIKPKKVFYISVDGVAPKAKMNQQRARRFRTIREKEEALAKAVAENKVIPQSDPFDSNCISPGTDFMTKLHEQLKYFIRWKISTDNAWASCKVIYSSHEVPGEGEHKIMDYIRYVRAQPDHDPNTRHCLYGLDADLIMLSLCTHEPNFSILREEVIYGGKNSPHQSSTPDKKHYCLLHIPLLRNYLDLEFSPLREALSFGYDIDKVIDDWVFMGFFVGNDFIPHLPQFHINTNALPNLYEVYKKVLPTLDGYINENGVLNLPRFQIFLKKLAEIEKDQFQDTLTDLKYFEDKTGRRFNSTRIKDNYVPNDDETFGEVSKDFDMELQSSAFNEDLKKLIKQTDEMFLDDDSWQDEGEDASMEDESDIFEAEFSMHKKDYYLTKLGFPELTKDVLRAQTEGYIRALQWILHYYYHGCLSWSWFYPYHYAPFISDIAEFKDFKILFDHDTPLKPYEQLLAILPVGSKQLLPKAFQSLMTSESSPIFQYYPAKFETDLNGKKNDWEAVVLIPFIDNDVLRNAMVPCYQYLTDEEKRRNTHGNAFLYEYTSENLGEIVAPAYFPKIKFDHARMKPLSYDSYILSMDKIVNGKLPNPYKDMYFPGFPTLKNLEYTAKFEKSKIKVFNYPVTNEHCVLVVTHDTKNEPSIENIACSLLGKLVWVGWPHIQRAKVVSVANLKYKYTYIPEKKDSNVCLLEDDEIMCVNKEDTNAAWWNVQSNEIFEHFMIRLGIDTGCVDTIVTAVHLKGYRHYTTGTNNVITEVDWNQTPTPYPYQTIIRDLKCAPVENFTRYKTLSDLFMKNDKVFMISGPNYGCMSEITETSSSGRISITAYLEDDLIISRYDAPSTYMPHKAAASKCGISDLLLSKITGLLFVSLTKSSTKPIRKNIGLTVRSIKQGECIAGYVQASTAYGLKWYYSQKCVDLICKYIERFRDMFNRLALIIGNEEITDADLFPDSEDRAASMKEVLNWISEQPYKLSWSRKIDSPYLEPDEIMHIYKSLKNQKEQLEKSKKVLRLQVKPSSLYKPNLNTGNIPPDPNITRYGLRDRVVCVNSKTTVPLGLKGTIVGISPSTPLTGSVNLGEKFNTEPIYDILFDETFLGAMDMDDMKEKFYRMTAASLINLSVGRNLHYSANVKTSIEKRPVNHAVSAAVQLRQNDGHGSAFANYSSPKKYTVAHQPPQERAPPPQPSFSNPNIPKKHVEDDSSTQFLRNMLKISNEQQSNRSWSGSYSNKTNGRRKPPMHNWRTEDIVQQPPLNIPPTAQTLPFPNYAPPPVNNRIHPFPNFMPPPPHFMNPAPPAPIFAPPNNNAPNIKILNHKTPPVAPNMFFPNFKHNDNMENFHADSVALENQLKSIILKGQQKSEMENNKNQQIVIQNLPPNQNQLPLPDFKQNFDENVQQRVEMNNSTISTSKVPATFVPSQVVSHQRKISNQRNPEDSCKPSTAVNPVNLMPGFARASNRKTTGQSIANNQQQPQETIKILNRSERSDNQWEAKPRKEKRASRLAANFQIGE